MRFFFLSKLTLFEHLSKLVVVEELNAGHFSNAFSLIT